MKTFVKEGADFVELLSKPLSNEAELQRLLEQHTNLIPLGIDARHQVVREFPTAAGPIDHLVIDAVGAMLVVETKLAKNADRRSVVAQAIDYAAQLTRYGPQELLDTVRQRVGEDFSEGWFETSADREELLRNLESNLRLGRLTMLIVMDEAESLLRDAVRFMNRATHFNCLLAEIRLMELDGREIVSVELYGDETIEDKKDRGGSEMDPESFVKIKSADGLGDEARAFLEALEWAKGEGGTTGPLTRGFYLAQTPFIGYNYMAWQTSFERMEVWSTADVHQGMGEYLAQAPGLWGQRLELRPSLKPDGKYGKVADVEARGASQADFEKLFRHYLSGPRAAG